MRRTIVRRRKPLGILALVFTAAAAVATALLLLGGGTAAAFDPTVVCGVDGTDQAAHRLQLNTVVLNPSATDPLAKTVAMEKDIYHCDAGPFIVGYRDLETFIEIVEKTATPSTPTMVTVDRRVEVVACDKEFATGVKCTTTTLPLSPTLQPNPFDGCVNPRRSTSFPPDTQMNTVAVGTNQVKTIKVDKEVFLCGSDMTLTYKDVYLFTEILERLTPDQGNITPYKKVVEGIACDRTGGGVSAAPTIKACNRFSTS